MKKIVLLICMLLLSVGLLSGCIDEDKSVDGVDSSWFEGTWLNNQNYDDATIELFFTNVFDDVIIYTRDAGEYNWSNPECSDFAVFYSPEVYNDYKNYVVYIELPLNNTVYLCSLWGGYGDVFEIYYGENEHMRFYKVPTEGR